VALYLLAVVTYILLGIFFPVLLYSWLVGAGYLLLLVWVLPAVVRRFAR